MKRITKGVALLATSMLMAACGSGDEESGGSDEGSGNAVSSDLTIGVLSTVNGAEVVDRWTNSTTSALDQIGIESIVNNGEGDPATQNQVLGSYITQKVDGIVIAGGFATGPVSQQLRAAKDAGIPVFTVGGSKVDDPDGLITGNYAVSPAELGKALGEYLVEKYPSGTQWVYIDLPAIGAAHEPIVAGQEVLDAAGWELVGSADLDATDFFEKTGPAAVDLFRANPDAEVLFSCCDYVPGVAVPALQRAGFEEALIAAEFDNLTTLDLIRKGDPVVTVATNTDVSVGVAVDQLLKVLDGGEADPAADEGLYEYEVIDSTNLPAEGEYAYPPQDTLAPYVQEWLDEYPDLKG